MTTDRTRRLTSFLPTNPDTVPQEATLTSGFGIGRAPLPPRLAALSQTAWEAENAAAMEAEASASTPAGQDPYLAFALRWWWLLILGALLGGFAAFGYTKYGPVPFQSIAQVQVPAQTTTDPTANSSQARSAATNYAAEAASPQMFALVSKALVGKLDLSANDLMLMNQQGQLDIRIVKNTNLISITVADPDPSRARLLADTFATVLVNDVNGRAATQLDARGLQLQEQIKQTQDRLVVAQLQQRAEGLRQELVTQRGQLLQLQLGYQQELQRQAESDRLAATNGVPTNPQIITTRTQWLKLISDQITALQTTLDDLTAQLNQVQATLKTLPAGTDPSVSAAFTTAYNEQLQSLTRDFAQVQLSGPGARTPLVRYGEASDPLAANGRKKILLMGLAAGIALAVGLGFGIDLLRQRGKRHADEKAEQTAETATTTTATSAQPRADSPTSNVVTQRVPDLVPLPMHSRPETPDVQWRRASGS